MFEATRLGRGFEFAAGLFSHPLAVNGSLLCASSARVDAAPLQHKEA
jgi:hypothetical protein